MTGSKAQRGAEPEVRKTAHDEILHVALRAAVVFRRFLKRHDFGQLFECVHAHGTVSKCGRTKTEEKAKSRSPCQEIPTGRLALA